MQLKWSGISTQNGAVFTLLPGKDSEQFYRFLNSFYHTPCLGTIQTSLRAALNACSAD